MLGDKTGLRNSGDYSGTDVLISLPKLAGWSIVSANKEAYLSTTSGSPSGYYFPIIVFSIIIDTRI